MCPSGHNKNAEERNVLTCRTVKLVGDGIVCHKTVGQCEHKDNNSPDCRSSAHVTDLVSDC